MSVCSRTFLSGFKMTDFEEAMAFIRGMQRFSNRGEARMDVIMRERKSIDVGMIESGGSCFAPGAFAGSASCLMMLSRAVSGMFALRRDVLMNRTWRQVLR